MDEKGDPGEEGRREGRVGGSDEGAEEGEEGGKGRGVGRQAGWRRKQPELRWELLLLLLLLSLSRRLAVALLLLRGGDGLEGEGGREGEQGEIKAEALKGVADVWVRNGRVDATSLLHQSSVALAHHHDCCCCGCHSFIPVTAATVTTAAMSLFINLPTRRCQVLHLEEDEFGHSILDPRAFLPPFLAPILLVLLPLHSHNHVKHKL